MLMTAVWHERVDLLEYLVRTVGANLSAVIPYMPNSLISLTRRTALQTAAAEWDKATTRKLIELGADVNAMDYLGRSALHYAVGDDVYDGGSTDEVSEYFLNLTAVLELLLHHGAQTEVGEQNQGETPLLRASVNGNTCAIRVLLDHGADTTASDDEGCTALHLAAWFGHHETVELLIEKGADIFAIDHSGRTPLDLSTSESISEVLTEAGALTGPELGRELERL